MSLHSLNQNERDNWLSWLKEIVTIRVDELAPSLGTVILAVAGEDPSIISKGHSGPHYYRPSEFFGMTVITDSFAKVIRRVVEVLSNKSSASVFLSADMGSGKTHLLTTLLHLFATCNLNESLCWNYVSEYERFGYSIDLAKNTVVIAADLRSPGFIHKYLKLTEKILSKLGAYKAAEIIKDSIDRGELPDPVKLAEEIPADKNILILIDELYNAAITGDVNMRKKVGGFLRFIQTFFNHRQAIIKGRSGIFMIVASARRDFEKWQEISTALKDAGKSDDVLFVNLIESFMEQMQRVEALVGVSWINVKEAQKILEKRLNLPRPFESIYHESFRTFIERIMKHDTDIPQAHHMRSLIKAMAIFAINALEAGDKLVTPAHFDERIIDTLMGDSDIGVSYRSIYDEIETKLNSDINLKLAVNAIFTLTVTGSPEKIIEMVKIVKTEGRTLGSVPLPLIKESELRNILKVHELSDIKINEIIEKLEELHDNIHRISLSEGGYAYFVAPVVSVLAVYRRLINERYRYYLGNPDKLVEIISNFVNTLERSDNYLEQSVVSMLDDLQKKPHSKDKLYIYIYFNQVLLSRLSNMETKEESYRELKNDVRKFLESKMDHNIVFVLPKVKKEVIHGFARYLATEEATESVINKYLAPLESVELLRKKDKILLELIKLEHQDLITEIGRRLNEALLTFTNAMRRLLVEAIYIVPGGVQEFPLDLERVERKLKLRGKELNEIMDAVKGQAKSIVEDVGKKLSEIVRSGYIHFVTKEKEAADLIFETLKEELKSKQNTTLYFNEFKFVPLQGSRYAYIPPQLVRKVTNMIKNRVVNSFKNYEILFDEDDEKIVISLEQKKITHKEDKESQEQKITHERIHEKRGVSDTKTTTRQAVVLPTHSVGTPSLLDCLDKLIERGGGKLRITIRVDKESANVLKQYLPRIKKYIEEFSIV